MKITVVGLGHVGAVAAAGLASAGHDVLAVDINPERVGALKGGQSWLYEPGLGRWVRSALQMGALRFLHRDEVKEDLGEIALVAVGTPPTQGAAADLQQVRAAVSWIKSMYPEDMVIAMKSTVPSGSGLRILEQELAGTRIRYVANPEFLREGQAVRDWESPDRIVIGAASNDVESVEVMTRMYAGIDAPIMATDITSAEMIKCASNAFLATRISFINEIAALCDSLGASIDDVSEGLAMDSRTGSRIQAGVGYGGSCFPKDVEMLGQIAQGSGANVNLLRSVINTDNRQRRLLLRALRQRFQGNLAGLRVGVLGLAFKPGTDDVRDAPAIDLIRSLAAEGVSVRAFDPRAMEAARPKLPTSVQLVGSVLEASDRAQALVLVTEWSDIVNTDWRDAAERMEPPRFIFDGRNVLNPIEMGKLGFEYMGVGRGRVQATKPVDNARMDQLHGVNTGIQVGR